MDDFRYTYAVARINTLSVNLLDSAFASRMLEAELDDIVRMLKETAYSESFASVEGPADIRKGLRREMEMTYVLLDKICPEKGLINLFRLRYDYHNLKVMLKSKLTGISDAGAILDFGTYPAGELSAAVRDELYRFAPEFIREAVQEALKEYEQMGALFGISCACDRLMWRHILDKAQKSRNKVMIKLFQEYVNLANIKTFFRVREFDRQRHLLEHYFIPGGSYDLDFFISHMEAELPHFLNHLSKTQYEHHIVSQGLRFWPEEKAFWRLELAADNYLLYFFYNLRHMIFSIAPLIYYLLRKEAEEKLIRTVIRGKTAGLSKQKIAERLRYVYV